MVLESTSNPHGRSAPELLGGAWLEGQAGGDEPVFSYLHYTNPHAPDEDRWRGFAELEPMVREHDATVEAMRRMLGDATARSGPPERRSLDAGTRDEPRTLGYVE